MTRKDKMPDQFLDINEESICARCAGPLFTPGAPRFIHLLEAAPIIFSLMQKLKEDPNVDVASLLRCMSCRAFELAERAAEEKKDGS
jgi:hypothetical protein